MTKLIGKRAYIKDDVDSQEAGGWGVIIHKDTYGFYHIAMYEDKDFVLVFTRDEFTVRREK